jgi:cell division protein FtsZ
MKKDGQRLARALKNPLMNRGELLEEAFHAIVHIRGGTNVTLGEVQIIMEELNRHINDRTHLFMGIGIEARMGNQLSVSILSALGECSAKPAQQASAKPVSKSISPPAHKPQALPPPSNEESTLSAMNGDPAKVVSNQPGESKQELILPRGKNEPQKPASTRAHSKSEAKAQTPVSKKAEAKQETLQFEPVSRGRFEKSEPTIIDGQDLDVPTFLRKNVKVR